MTYTNIRLVPKSNKKKIKKRILVPLLLLLSLVIYTASMFVYNAYFKEEKVFKTVCDFNHAQSKAALIKEPSNYLLELNDYFIYGETLNLFNQEYQLGKPDLFVGKTIILVNVCDDLERVYMVETNVDGQIPMEDLPVGFYEVYVMFNLQRHRLFTTGYLEDVFTTINRNENTKQVRLIADAYLLENDRDGATTFDRNYLFIEVSHVELPETAVDIVIDPGHRSYDQGWLDLGVRANDLIEADENYKMALALKEEFEKAGLSVLILREENEAVNTYDINGRLHRAYNANAKYYLEVQMIASNNPAVFGTQIVYSSYTSPRLASTVFKQLIENTRLQSTGISGAGNIPGVIPSTRINGWDARMVIRESGGKALSAGSFSEKAQVENGSFALNNRRGLHTITIEYIYLTHKDSALYWILEYPLYAQETVKGFLNYWGLAN